MLKPTQVTLLNYRLSKSATQIAILCFTILISILDVMPAQASLGGDPTSVETDRITMKAEHATRQSLAATGNYNVHEITLPYGTMVRQYVARNGAVFAVAWNGPFLPDFRQLLGLHFDTMVAHQAKQTNAGHRFLIQHEGDLVIESGGHQRSFSGRAFLKNLIPVGVTEQEIQ